jgi:predicted AAA+ superfamily ATPase
VGKTTLVLDALKNQGSLFRYASADEPGLRGSEWIAQQWEAARLDARDSGEAIVALDEIQKVPDWSETVKRLWDEDTREGRNLKVIILGSAPLLIARGLSESLAGRFEILRLPHWSYVEMLGQLHDAGNSTSLAHYLNLLSQAGMVKGLPKYSGDTARSRGSSPKLQVLNTALISAASGRSFEEALKDHEFWGHLVESSVGAYLANAEAIDGFELSYWRENNREVDFVVRSGRRVTAIEVKSGRSSRPLSGIAAFQKAFHADRSLLVGGDGIGLETFLDKPVSYWVN